MPPTLTPVYPALQPLFTGSSIRFHAVTTQHERLISAMKAAGKDWQDVKSALHLTRAGIKKWCDGNFTGMTAVNVFALADFLGCDARWLAIGDQSKAATDAFGQVQRAWEQVSDEGRQELLRHAEYISSQARFFPASPRIKGKTATP